MNNIVFISLVALALLLSIASLVVAYLSEKTRRQFVQLMQHIEQLRQGLEELQAKPKYNTMYPNITKRKEEVK